MRGEVCTFVSFSADFRTRIMTLHFQAESKRAGGEDSQLDRSSDRVWTLKELEILNELCKPIIVVVSSIYDSPHTLVAYVRCLAHLTKTVTNFATRWQGAWITEPA